MKVQPRTIVFFVTTFVAHAACARRGPSSPERSTREGVYVAGIEANTFRECGEALQWQVDFAPDVDPREWPRGASGGFNATYYLARWKLEMLPPPRVPIGQPAASPPRVRVYEILELRPLRQGECGERF